MSTRLTAGGLERSRLSVWTVNLSSTRSPTRRALNVPTAAGDGRSGGSGAPRLPHPAKPATIVIPARKTQKARKGGRISPGASSQNVAGKIVALGDIRQHAID